MRISSKVPDTVQEWHRASATPVMFIHLLPVNIKCPMCFPVAKTEYPGKSNGRGRLIFGSQHKPVVVMKIQL